MRQELKVVAPAPRRRAGGYPSFSLLRRMFAKLFPSLFRAEGAMQTAQKTEKTMQTKTAATTQLRRLAQTAIDGLCRKVLQLKADLQQRACCIEWAHDCPFHTTAEVTKALQLPEKLNALRLRLAMALKTQKECS